MPFATRQANALSTVWFTRNTAVHLPTRVPLGCCCCCQFVTGADLRKASLPQAVLNGVDLAGAEIARINLSSCDLRGEMRDAVKETRTQNTRERAILEGHALGTCLRLLLCHCDRRGSSGRNFSRRNLQGANLSNADLRRTNLTGANLSNVTLTNARLGRATLTRANLSQCNLRGVHAM